VFGSTPSQALRWIALCALLPFLLSALRIGATASLVLLIGMERLTGASGIGWLISFTCAGSNLPLMYAYVTLSGLLGVLVTFCWATRWHAMHNVWEAVRDGSIFMAPGPAQPGVCRVEAAVQRIRTAVASRRSARVLATVL